ncbi:MAG: ATP-binding protein [Christensenellales bacterium]|jgi:anti-sigma regulatory factor (Ser/Thr protein kinase)|nr:ATP-binding protein [Clostridiales bacterium]
MEEISLHVLDIVQNSLNAGAALIHIEVDEQEQADTLIVRVADDGSGMPPELVAKVTDPFVTTRTTRKVGLGLPLFMQGAKAADGDFSIQSEVGKGTRLCATYRRSHIDRQPVGDMAGTVQTLVLCNPDTDFVYTRRFNDRSFTLDTRELRRALGSEVPLNAPEVRAWIRDYLIEGEKGLLEVSDR